MWIVLHFGILGAVLALVFGAGRTLARRLGTRDPIAAWVLGLAATSLSVLGLAIAGLLPPPGGGWWLLAAIPAALAALSPPPARPSRGALGASLLFGLLLLPVLLLAATPIVSWDADAYHLSVPRLYLEAGGLRIVPMNVYSNWPLGTEMLYLAALGIGDASVAKLLHGAFGFLILASLWHLAGPRARSGAVVAGLLWLANPLVLFEHRVAYVELAQAFWLLAAFVLLERARREPATAAALLPCAGLAAGMLGATKLTGLVQAPILAAVALPAVVRAHGRRALARFALPFVVPLLPWPIKAWGATGNPLYPFLFGGPDWSPRLSEQLSEWQRSIGAGREPLDHLLLPLRVFLEGGRGYDRFDGELAAAGVILLPLGALGALGLAPERRGTALRALAIAGALFLLWGATAQQMRLLLPGLLLACLAAGWGLAGLAARLSPQTRRGPALVVALCALLVLGGNREVLAAGWRAGARMATLPPDAVRESGRPPLWRELDDRLPPDALLLMLQANGRFFASTEILADSFFEASQIADWLGGSRDEEEVLERLRRRGVTHVLLDRRPRPVRWPETLLGLLERPDLLLPVWTSPDGRYRLWAVPPARGGGADR